MDTEVIGESVHIKTDSYEGPFELVIELIEKRKLLVNEITLAQITDEFIAHVRGQAQFPMEAAANFIGVAATLLLIKSKSLIPDLELSSEEESDVEELKRRLMQYEETRETARELAKLFGRSVMVERGERTPEPIFSPSSDLSKANLEQSLDQLLASLAKEEKLPEVRVRPVVTIEEMMERLLGRVQKALSLSFKEFSGESKERVEVIVSFLALLELIKMGRLDASQDGGHFSDINIKNLSADVPSYG
ncbi:MAG: segregation and condensation protein A [Parcubacteria bacterium C7867-001]|nr:MAG: segregation and condensation protein A [Parcubacteria bacterium C7867-001]